MIRIELLNGANKNNDYGFNFLTAMFTEGVLGATGFASVDNAGTIEVAVGKALVEVTRTTTTPEQTFKILVENTSQFDIAKTDGDLVLRVAKSKVNNGELNNEDGSGVATIEIGTDFGDDYVLKIGEIVGGTLTDTRELIQVEEDKLETVVQGLIDTSIVDKADKDNVLELDNTTEFTPDADYEPATKKYVDQIAGTKQNDKIFEALSALTVSNVLAIINKGGTLKVGKLADQYKSQSITGDGTPTGGTSVARLKENTYFYAYSDGADSNRLKGLIITWDEGTGLYSFGTPVNINISSGTFQHIKVECFNELYAVVVYNQKPSSGTQYPRYTKIDIDGSNAITVRTTTNIYSQYPDTVTVYDIKMCKNSETKGTFAYSTNHLGYYSYFRDFTISSSSSLSLASNSTFYCDNHPQSNSWDLCRLDNTYGMVCSLHYNSNLYFQGVYNSNSAVRNSDSWGSNVSIERFITCNVSTNNIIIYRETGGGNGRFYKKASGTGDPVFTLTLDYTGIKRIVKIGDNNILAIESSSFNKATISSNGVTALGLEKHFIGSTSYDNNRPIYDAYRDTLITSSTYIYSSTIADYGVAIAKETVASGEDIITTVRGGIAKWSSITADDIGKAIRMSKTGTLYKTSNSNPIVGEAVDVGEFYFKGKEIV